MLEVLEFEEKATQVHAFLPESLEIRGYHH